MIYGCDGEPVHPDERGEVIRKDLLERRGMGRFGAVLRVCAAVDYVLMRFITVAHRNQASPPISPEYMEVSEAVQRSLEMMRLRSPLIIRQALGLFSTTNQEQVAEACG